jgi:hypothetical protein
MPFSIQWIQTSRRTELYSTVTLDVGELQNTGFQKWQHHYNWQRPHRYFKSKKSIEVVCEHLEKHSTGIKY